MTTDFTTHIREAATTAAADAGRPALYLRNARAKKEKLIEQIWQRDRIDEGLIAVLSAVEPCRTWFARGDRQEHKLRLELGWGKCIHLYFYLVHPVFGLMHLRLQTWFPFLLHVCLNGREWLARQMQAEGLDFTREDNCFTHLADPARAQSLLDAQLQTRWDRLLNPLAQVSRAASERHLEALAAVACETALAETLAPVCRAIVRDGQRYRAVHPFAPLDQTLLRTIDNVEFALHGLRNRDLRAALKPVLPTGLTEKQIAGRIGRLLRWLRAHGLLAKVARTQRYRVTTKGRLRSQEDCPCEWQT